ncbi:MAG: S8 family serine peptidase [Pseudomonadota bacterium]|nr:S8 family serine peptidase [Pseudomonadota bacterium]
MRLIIMLLTATASIAVAGAASAEPRYIANEFICNFDSSVAPGNVRAEAARAAGQSGTLLHVYQHSIRGFAVRMPAGSGSRSQVAQLRANNPKVARCEQDQIMEIVQKGKPGGGGTTQPAEAPDWGVTRVGGSAAPVAGRTAWVIDTGIDLDHPDLNVDVTRSKSFIRDSSPDDGNGHGTHVAGTIAAVDNEIGVIGVAAGAPVVAVRVLDSRGSGTNSGVIAGVDYVAAAGKLDDVANMSLGGGVSLALDTAVVNASLKGIRFVLAAGNESDHANNHSPARAEGKNVFTVSSFAKGDVWSSFSNFGNPPVDYAEPGSSIRSTYKGGGYATLSGTSMAAPHLAGILMTGPVQSNSAVTGDPDGQPDSIGTR